jgi:hypothetical protein
MTRAREADRAGDQSTCEKALAEVQRVLLLVAIRCAPRLSLFGGGNCFEAGAGGRREVRPFQIRAIANQSQQHEHSGRAEAIHIK